jgi:hypothetical protein
MERSDTNDIGRTLIDINKGNSNVGNLLIFDPRTGEFVVLQPDEPVSPDVTTINQIAEDGFA